MIEKGKWYKVRKGAMQIDDSLIGILFRVDYIKQDGSFYGEDGKGRSLYFYKDELVPLEERKEDKEYLDLFV